MKVLKNSHCEHWLFWICVLFLFLCRQFLPDPVPQLSKWGPSSLKCPERNNRPSHGGTTTGKPLTYLSCHLLQLLFVFCMLTFTISLMGQEFFGLSFKKTCFTGKLVKKLFMISVWLDGWLTLSPMSDPQMVALNLSPTLYTKLESLILWESINSRINLLNLDHRIKIFNVTKIFLFLKS